MFLDASSEFPCYVAGFNSTGVIITFVWSWMMILIRWMSWLLPETVEFDKFDDCVFKAVHYIGSWTVWGPEDALLRLQFALALWREFKKGTDKFCTCDQRFTSLQYHITTLKIHLFFYLLKIFFPYFIEKVNIDLLMKHQQTYKLRLVYQ